MTDSLDNSQKLGSAHAEVGYTYDPRGMDRFLADGKQAIEAVKQFQRELAQAQQQAPQQRQAGLPQRRPVASPQQQQTDQQAVAVVIRLAQAEAQLARRLEDSTGELAALRRAQEAATGDRLAYLRATERVAAAEQRLQREQRPSFAQNIASGTTQGLLDMAGAFGIATTAGAAFQLLVNKTVEGFKLDAQIQQTKTNLGILVGSQREANAVFEEANEFGARYKFTQGEIAQAVQGASRIIQESDQPVEKVLETLSRLQTLNPEENIAGAARALSELKAGQIESIVERFNLSRTAANDLKKEIESGQDPVAALDAALNRMGVTSETLKTRTEGAAGALNDGKIASENLALALGRVAQSKGAVDVLQALADAGNDVARSLDYGGQLNRFNAQILDTAQNYDQYVAGINKANEAIPIYLSKIKAVTPEQFAAAQSLIEMGASAEQAFKQVTQLPDALAKVVANAATLPATVRELLPTLIELGNESAATSKEVDGLVADFLAGKIGPDELKSSVKGLTERLSEQKREAGRVASVNAQLAASNRNVARSAEQLKKAQEELESALASAGNELVQARERRDDQLTSLEEKYAEKVTDLQQRAAEAAQETQDAIVEATRAAADERIGIIQEAAERESEVVTDFAERRAKLIQDQQTRQAERDQQFQQEQDRARAQARTDELRSTADFITRLNDLTRKGRGRGQSRDERKEARAALAQAQQEAAQLAQTDPAAAQQFLAARQRQILEDIEQRRADAQLRKDARRGGGLRSAEVEAEIAEEARLRDEADRAEIEAIKRGAVDRQQQRDQERAKQQASDQQALDDLNKQEAVQLDKVRDATAERLREFDARQSERIAQLKKHGDEQQAEIQRQLVAEEGEYKKSRDQINRDYARFLLDLREELQKQANSLNLTPEQARQQELTDAYRAIGQELGQAFADGLQQAARTGQLPVPSSDLGREPQPQRRPPANSPGTFSRGSVVGSSKDRIISDQGIDQVVQGGRQTDGFNSKRDSTGTHAGVDIAAPEGTPIKTPVAGTVQSLPDHPVFGKRIIIAGDDGSEWYFGHLQRSLAGNGARVKAGQTVAQVGSTGHVSGPHLHLQYKPGSGEAAQDPTALLEQLAQQPAQAQASAGGGARAGGSPTPQSATTRPISQTQAPAGGLEALAISPLQAMGDRASASASAPPVQVDRSIHVSVSGPFAPGVSMDQVKQAVRQGVEEGIAAESRNISQQLSQLDTKGALAL